MPLLEIAAILTAVLCILLVILYLYLTRHFNYWKERGVPYIKPLPFFGNLMELFLQKHVIASLLQKLYNENKNFPYVGIFAIDKPALLLNDLEVIKDVLQRHADHFPDHNSGSNEYDTLWANMIFNLNGQRWKNIRNKLTPTFTSGKMKLMFHLVNNCAELLNQVIESSSSDGSSVSVKEMMTRFTADVIAQCAMGIECNALRDPNSEVKRQCSKAFEFSIKKTLKGVMMWFTPELYCFLNIKFLEEDTYTFFRDTVWQTIQYREENGIVRKDLIDSLMELRKQDLEGGGGENHDMRIDGDMLVAQVLIIFLAGYETSSSAATFTLYELSLHPEIQNKARFEILEVLENNKEFTYEAIQEMKYLDMVVCETLRKYPLLGFIDRVCNKEFEIQNPSGGQNVTIQQGLSVYVPLMGIHNDPEYFPMPEKYDPERFTEESKKERPSFCYLPFGEGPRTCIGKRFGLMQVKTALAHILSQFEVTPCKDTPQKIIFDTKSFVLQPQNEIFLMFRRIHDRA